MSPKSQDTDQEARQKMGPPKKKTLFSFFTSACLIVCLPLANRLHTLIGNGETLDGYGSLGLTLSLMVVLLLCGVIFGQIALFRGERPLLLPLLALLLNAGFLIALLINFPGR